MPKYLVEVIGFNDGLPYAKFGTESLHDAQVVLQGKRFETPRVGYRLVEVLEEYLPIE